MLHVGLDLSRKRLDFHVMDAGGHPVWVSAVSPDGPSLDALAERVGDLAAGEQVCAAIESMNGARFVHDRLELDGWQVEVADAQRAKGLAPLACKTDRIDAWVLAELSRRDLVPAIWLPPPGVRQSRELGRWRLHVVKRRTALKSRVHATLITFGHPCPVSDLFGVNGRRLLEQLALPEPWASTTSAAVELIDDLDREIIAREAQMRRLGADLPYVELLQTAPGIGPVLGYTIAVEVGDISRFESPTKFVGYTGLCPRVYQSGGTDHRGPLSKHGPKYLRWAFVEAAVHAANHPAYRARYERTRRRLGKNRGPKVARVEVARELAKATWHMLTHNENFAPAGASRRLVA